MATIAHHTLFGGERGWHAHEWTASDDRVRGGRSQSYLKIHDRAAIFCGTLDFETLGGAGFASQRTTDDKKRWNLSHSNAIELLIDTAKSDEKQYTFILKDEVLPRNPDNGREQSTTSWEYDFSIKEGSVHAEHAHLTSVVIPYEKLQPTYRGKKKDPGHPIKISDIRRLSVMMRSFFGEQQGDFSLCLVSISAINTRTAEQIARRPESSISSQSSTVQKATSTETNPRSARPTGIWSKLFALCHKL